MTALQFRRTALCFCLVATPILVSGCGGGGGSSFQAPVAVFTPPPPVVPPPLPPPPPPTPLPPTSGSGWQAGVFESSGVIKDSCEIVRTGVDSEGRAFPDKPGSLLAEKFWLRSWTNETYLWNDEVQDRDPASIAGKLDYFALLRTTAKTPSNRDKDNFHFSEPTEEFLRNRNSVGASGYGARFAILSSTRPRDIRVRYTEPNSPATELVDGKPKFVRGTRIISINGVDAINGGASQSDVDILNAALAPPLAGTTTTFVVRDPGASADRTFTITSANIAVKPVNRTQVLATPTGNVGYILFNTFSPFSSEREIRDAIEGFQTQSVTDVVLDLRYNGGGLLTVASQLSFMIAGPTATAGKSFETLRFNSRSGGFNPVTGAANTPQPFRGTGAGFTVTSGTPLPTLNLRRVFVLSTSRTCSASEAVINGLRGIDVEVILIGGTTCGKPFGFYPTSNCGETYYTIQFQGLNNKGFGDYADGFTPSNSTSQFGVRVAGCAVGDDLSRELGDPQENMLAAALSFRATGTCLNPPAAEAKSQSVSAVQTNEEGIELPRGSIFDSNRDMTPPR